MPGNNSLGRASTGSAQTRGGVGDALDQLWNEIQQELSSGSLPVFPSMPTIEPRAYWPTDDWTSFIDLARRAHADLIYCQQFKFDDDVLDDVSRDIFEGRTGERVEAQPLSSPPGHLDSDVDMLPDLEPYRGEPFMLVIGFASGGMGLLHGLVTHSVTRPDRPAWT